MIHYTRENTEHFKERDFEYLKELKLRFTEKPERSEIPALLQEYQFRSKNGLIVSIEMDLKGYYDLNQSETFQIVPVEKFANLDSSERYHLIQNRLDSILPGEFDFPENIYKTITIGIYYQNSLIPVDEVRRKEWDWILYKEKENPRSPQRVFVEILKGGVALYSTTSEIAFEDTLKLNRLTEEKLCQLINKYR